MTKKRLIRAVHERDLDEFLQEAGLLDDLEAGRLRCAHCGEILTRNDISRFVVRKKVALVLCSRLLCYNWGGDEDSPN